MSAAVRHRSPTLTGCGHCSSRGVVFTRVRLVIIHGLTASITNAVRVANLLERSYADLEINAQT
jgi:cytidine deaminase